VKITPKAKATLGSVLHLLFQQIVFLVLRHLIEWRILAHLALKKAAPVRFLGRQPRDDNAQHAKRDEWRHPGGAPRNFHKCARGINDHASHPT
jgi:hypothetical protein